jgi:AGZA family xanthine/uracil permease-like MFS transporter
MPIITIVCLGILLLGWVAKKKMPGGLPVGLVAIAIGTLIGWVTGRMDPSAVAGSLENFGFHVPTISLFSAIPNFGVVLPFLLSAIPFGIYNFIETMDNVESAEAAGDSYNTTQIMVFDASTSFVGALFGNPVPTTVYIGHPGWKSVGARIGYGWGTGLGVFIIATTGLGAVLISLIPIAALLPILVYIGIVIGAQAFDAIPKRHMPAVVVAILPSLADWGRVLVGNAVGAAGGDLGAISLGDFANNGIHFAGMNTLADGAIIVGILWAATTVFMIDRKDVQAIITIVVASVLSFFGIIHSGSVGFAVGWEIAVGYLLLAIVVFVLSKQGYIEEKVSEE